eukprot:IDg3071t1
MDSTRLETNSRSSDIVLLSVTCLPVSGEALVRSSSDIVFYTSIYKLLGPWVAFKLDALLQTPL